MTTNNNPSVGSLFGYPPARLGADDRPSSQHHPSPHATSTLHSRAILEAPEEDDFHFNDAQAWDDPNLSGSEYEDSASSSAEPDAPRRRDDATISQWLRYTEQERAIAQQVGEADSRNLTYHLLNVHGIAAQKYPDANSHKPPLNGTTHRREWAPGWIPRRTWTRWPLRPEHVPRVQPAVWSDSIQSSEPWTPSSELEDCLFSKLLRTARAQWDSRESVPPEQPRPPEKPRPEKPQEPKKPRPALKYPIPPEIKPTLSKMEPSAVESLNQKSTTASIDKTQEDEQTTKKRMRDNEQAEFDDAPVFSLDDERSRQLLQPMIRSTISSLDSLLEALFTNRKGARFPVRSRKRRKHDQTEPGIENHDAATSFADSTHRRKRPASIEQDWSQVLGLAGICGMPSAAVSRAATRCAALFNENMSFALLREQDNSKPRSRVVFQPSTIQDRAELTEPSPPIWNIENGCPFPDCNWFGRRFPAEAKQTFRISEHMRRAHNWDLAAPANLPEELTGMSGGVHVDGYLKPIAIRSGWRGRDVDARKSGSIPVSRSRSARQVPPGTRRLASEFLSPEPRMSGALDPGSSVNVLFKTSPYSGSSGLDTSDVDVKPDVRTLGKRLARSQSPDEDEESEEEESEEEASGAG